MTAQSSPGDCSANGGACVNTCTSTPGAGGNFCDTSNNPGALCDTSTTNNCSSTHCCFPDTAIAPNPAAGCPNVTPISCNTSAPGSGGCCGTDRCSTNPAKPSTCTTCMSTIGSVCFPHAFDTQGTCCGGLHCTLINVNQNIYECLLPTGTPTPQPTLVPPPQCGTAFWGGSCVPFGNCGCPQDTGSGATATCLSPSTCGPNKICCNPKVTPTPKPAPTGALAGCAAMTDNKGHCYNTCPAGTWTSVEATKGPTDCSLKGNQCCAPTGCGSHGGVCLTAVQLKALKGNCPFDYTSNNNYDCGSGPITENSICCAPSSCYQGGNFCSTTSYCQKKDGQSLDNQSSNTACRNNEDICCDAPASTLNFGTCAGNNSLCTDSPINPDIFGGVPTPVFKTATESRINACNDEANKDGVGAGTNLYCCPINYPATGGTQQAIIYGPAVNKIVINCPVNQIYDTYCQDLSIICTDAPSCPGGTTAFTETMGGPYHSPTTCQFIAQDNGATGVVRGCQLPSGGQIYGNCADKKNYCTNYADTTTGNCNGGAINPPTYTTVADPTCSTNAYTNGLSNGHPVYCYRLQQRNLGQCSNKPDTMCTNANSCPGGKTPIYNDTSGGQTACGKAAQKAGVTGGSVVHCCPLDNSYNLIPTLSNTNVAGFRDPNAINPCPNGNCQTAVGNLATNPATLLTDLFRIVLGLAGGATVLLLIKGGYQFLTSRGNPEKLQSAKEVITSAIVGLLFLIFSVAILEIISVDILQIPGIGK